MKKIVIFLSLLLLSFVSMCQCDSIFVNLDTLFYKVVENGHEYKPVKYIEEINEDDTIQYLTVDICDGDSIILIADIGTMNENECTFIWDFGDGIIDTINGNTWAPHKYETVTGYNVFLRVINNNGCEYTNSTEIRVRIAKNPIKTLNPLSDICSGTELGINVSFGANSTIIVDSLTFERQAKERYEETVFIPDGPQCHHVSQSGCYDAPVTFDQFPPGATVQDGDDILALCINMEHSYLGDLKLEVFCPNGQSIVLKDFYDGGGTNLGNDIDESYNPNCCDTSCAPMGEGWTYCFSTQYLDGAQGYIGNSNSGTADSTNTVDTIGYYQPLGSFDNLIGCPLNGEWMLRVCDTMSIDNGFVFWWDLELGQTGVDWEYQVPLDSVIFSGVDFIHQTNAFSGLFAPSIDDYGEYIIDISIIDDFGCIWDTNTNLTVIQTPVFDLGNDTSMCENNSINITVPIEANSYIWEPNGETTQTITVYAIPNTNVVTYTAMATQYNDNIFCSYQDSIKVFTYPGVLASFSSDKIPLEGCEPFEINFINKSTNNFINTWYIGDNVSNEINPSLTLPYGVYDVKLIVESQNGCKDSIWYNDLITVFTHPKADFGFEPLNPYASEPTVNIVNLTEPNNNNNQYHWVIQTNKDNINDIINLFGNNPTYTWYPQSEQTVAGDYYIFLDAYSVNIAQSGYTYECHDTLSKIITIINDNLLFPNVITPNNDGINDVFVIHNLIDGQAFPDNELSIYDRNGKRIFFKQDIRHENDFWKPTNEPTGTYFYRFIGNGPVKCVEYNGIIEILR